MWKDETGEVNGASENDAEEMAGSAQGNSPRAPLLQDIHGASHAEPASVQDMRVDHSRRNVAVPQEFLNGTDVVAVLQEMRGEGVVEDVAIHSFVNRNLAIHG